MWPVLRLPEDWVWDSAYPKPDMRAWEVAGPISGPGSGFGELIDLR
jgi:hypothetical protein